MKEFLEFVVAPDGHRHRQRKSKSARSALTLLPEKPGGHAEADRDDGGAEDGLGNLAGEAGGGVSADRAGDHGEQTVAPYDLAIEDEDQECDSVGHGGGDNLQCVDLVEVLEAEEGEQGDDEESCARAE